MEMKNCALDEGIRGDLTELLEEGPFDRSSWRRELSLCSGSIAMARPPTDRRATDGDGTLIVPSDRRPRTRSYEPSIVQSRVLQST